MRMIATDAVAAARKGRRAARLAALVALGAALAGCNSSGGGQVDNTLGTAGSQGGQQAAAAPATPEVQDPRAYCPKTVLRAGTETFNLYPANMRADDPDARQKLRFRATITEIVRECNYAGETLTMKVGVAGRILSGPSGETGEFLMPIRVAVTEGDTVLYSQLHDVPAQVPPGRTNNTFTFVDSQVVIPKPRRENVLVYVGYDEQRTDAPGAPGAQARGGDQPRPRIN